MSEFKVIFFGNKYIEEDSLALDVAEALSEYFPQVAFFHIEDVFQLISFDLSNVIILDVVKNIKRVSIVNLEKVSFVSRVSAHDLDVGFFLKLLNKEVIIVGIPIGYEKSRAVLEAKDLISRILASRHLGNELSKKNKDRKI